MHYLQKKLMELICWVCNRHVPVARMRFEDERMVGYYECSRCKKELE